MDTAALHEAYRTLLDAADAVAAAEETPVPPPGEWDADQILAHVSLVTAATIAAVAGVATASPTTYDNRTSLDTWTIGRIVERAGGNAGLRARVRAQAVALCAFGGPALGAAELDTRVPTLLLSNDRLGLDEPLRLRDILDGIAGQELPGHTAQLLALLPAGSA